MATMEQRLIDLVDAFAADIKQARLARGDLTSLSTSTKSNLVSAINEVFTIASSATGVIDDAAGDGATNKTWSADKIGDTLALAISALRTELTSGASAALDTFAELAAALNNDPNFASTIATGLTKRVRFDAAQTLTAAEQEQACANLGLGNPFADFAALYAAAKA